MGPLFGPRVLLPYVVANDDPPNNVVTGGSGRYVNKLYATRGLFFGLCVLLPSVSTCGGPTDCVGTDSSGCHPVGLPFIGIGNSLSETVEQHFMCYMKAFIRSFCSLVFPLEVWFVNESRSPT